MPEVSVTQHGGDLTELPRACLVALHVPDEAATAIAVRVSRLRRSASASAVRAAGASDGSVSRDQSPVSVAAVTVEAAQWPSCPLLPLGQGLLSSPTDGRIVTTEEP